MNRDAVRHREFDSHLGTQKNEINKETWRRCYLQKRLDIDVKILADIQANIHANIVANIVANNFDAYLVA